MQEIPGNRALYRSPQEMVSSRNLKGIQSKAWFKLARGGKKISLAKDYSVKTSEQDRGTENYGGK